MSQKVPTGDIQPLPVPVLLLLSEWTATTEAREIIHAAGHSLCQVATSISLTRYLATGRLIRFSLPISCLTLRSTGSIPQLLGGCCGWDPLLEWQCLTSVGQACPIVSRSFQASTNGWTTSGQLWTLQIWNRRRYLEHRRRILGGAVRCHLSGTVPCTDPLRRLCAIFILATNGVGSGRVLHILIRLGIRAAV